jgi:membrane protease YdiL (CAAX protease family)
MATLFYGAMLGVAVAWSFFADRSLLYANAEAAAAGLSPARDLGVRLLAGGIVILLSHEFTRRTRSGQALARAFGAILGPLSVVDCLVLAVWSGVAEEAFFRGALQPLVGWVPASLLFGAVHFVPRGEFLPWTGFAVAAGFLLGWLFDATGNLLAPIVAHALINAVNLRFISGHYAGTGSAG